MEGKKGSETDDYFILFRDATVPDSTPEIYKKRSKEEDLFLGDKAEYVWAYVGKLKDRQARFVQGSLDKPFEEEFKKKIGSSNVGIPSQYAFEIAVRNPLDRTRKDLIKASPNLGFLSRMHHFLLHFWYYPESDEESLQIKQVLESQIEKGGRGIYWHMHTFNVPKTHRSFVQLLSSDTLINGLKRANYWRETGAPRRAAAIWVIETTLAPVKLTFPGFTMRLPFMTPPPLPMSPLSNARAAFESVVLNDKDYIPALTECQLEVFERGVTVANNIRTTDHCGYLNIKNKYEVFRTNGTLEPQAQPQYPTAVINEIKELKDQINKFLPAVSAAKNPDPVPKKEAAKTKSANDAKAAKQPAKDEKPGEKPPKTRNSGEEFEGRKMAAVKYAIDNPGITIKLIESKYDLSERTLSREPYAQMIKKGRKFTINQREAISKENEIEFRAENKRGGTKRKRGKPLTKVERESKELDKLADDFLRQAENAQ